LVTLAITGSGLVAWKRASVRKADAAAARQPEPIESVTLATARARQYRPATTAVGTILALNSITLRNELAGTVSQVTLVPGQVVEAGAVPERRQGADPPAGGRCRGQRGRHGGRGGAGRAGPGRAGRRVRVTRPPSADGPDRRGRRADRCDDSQRIGAGPDPEPRPSAGCLGAGRGPGGTRDDGRLDSGERPPQRAQRRPRLLDRRRLGPAGPRACAAGANRTGA